MTVSLSTPLVNSYYTLVRSETSALDISLAEEIRGIERRFAANGMLASGNTLIAVCDAGSASLKARLLIARDALYRCLDAYGVDLNQSILGDVYSELGRQAAESSASVTSIVRGAAVFRCGLGSRAEEAAISRVADTLAREVAKMKVDAELRAAASQRKAADFPLPQFVITGNGNTVVSGDGNTTHVANLDPRASAHITSSMTRLLEDLGRAPDADDKDREQLRIIAEEVIREAKEQSPNLNTLKRGLSSAASVIKFIPSMKSTYDVLKWAAGFIGLTLP